MVLAQNMTPWTLLALSATGKVLDSKIFFWSSTETCENQSYRTMSDQFQSLFELGNKPSIRHLNISSYLHAFADTYLKACCFLTNYFYLKQWKYICYWQCTIVKLHHCLLRALLKKFRVDVEKKVMIIDVFLFFFFLN